MLQNATNQQYEQIDDSEQTIPKLKQKSRLDFIEANIIKLTQTEMAQQLNVDRATIVRDLDEWRRQGGYTRFLLKEFFELYGLERLKNPSKSLDRIVQLISKCGPEVSVSDEPSEIRLTLVDPFKKSVAVDATT